MNSDLIDRSDGHFVSLSYYGILYFSCDNIEALNFRHTFLKNCDTYNLVTRYAHSILFDVCMKLINMCE